MSTPAPFLRFPESKYTALYETTVSESLIIWIIIDRVMFYNSKTSAPPREVMASEAFSPPKAVAFYTTAAIATYAIINTLKQINKLYISYWNIQIEILINKFWNIYIW